MIDYVKEFFSAMQPKPDCASRGVNDMATLHDQA